MFQDIVQLIMVTGGLVLLLIIPFLPAARLLFKGKEWPTLVLAAMILGCSSQAASGLLWSHLVKGAPHFQPLAYLGTVLLITLGALLLSSRVSLRKESPSGWHRHWPLVAILLAAFVVRSLHPLQTYALGQSDAYTHLHYLNYIVEQGYLANIVYPSGYHWLLALPVLLLQVDPYLVARFAGAFFGSGLVLAIYVGLYRLKGGRAALFGSFCAACFPAMLLLMKTGVGAFANQLGLFFIPCILWCYVALIENGLRRGETLLFVMATLGIAASVPMMLIHIVIIIGCERLVTLLQQRKRWGVTTLKILFLVLPAVLLMAFHFSQAGPNQRFQTAQVLTSYSGPKSDTEAIIQEKVELMGQQLLGQQRQWLSWVISSPYFDLVLDFFSVKRLGFSNSLMDSMAGLLFLLFLSCGAYGLIRGHKGMLVLGLWGGLTVVQATTGYFQFSSYQREGWSLLIAICCLCAVMAATLHRYLGKFMLWKGVVLLVMLVSFVWTLRHPPAHPAFQSSAEDLLIRTVRSVAVGESASQGKLSPLLDPSLPVTLVTRKFVGWSNQGELVPNVLPPNARVNLILVNSKSGGDVLRFVAGNQYVVLLDQEPRINSVEMRSTFAMVAPGLVSDVLKQQQQLYRANNRIMEYLQSLDRDLWLVRTVMLSPQLTVYVVVYRTDTLRFPEEQK